MINVQRIRAILQVDRTSTTSVLSRAHAVTNGMGADPKLFSGPTPPLIVIDAQIAKVDAAEQLAATRVNGAAVTRNMERGILVTMLESERSYVQLLCDTSPQQAVPIIAAAGMFVAASPVKEQPVLKVTCGSEGGSANLAAYSSLLTGQSGKRSFFNWQWTTDGGKTFTNAPSTALAKTTITGFPPMTPVGFRVCVTDRDGPGDWTPTVTILIL